MDEKSKEILQAILEADKDTLSKEQLGFVMARRGYLNDEQKKRFEKEIKLHEKGELFKDEEEGENLESLSLAKLLKKAKELGIKTNKDMDKKAVIKLINATEEENEG